MIGPSLEIKDLPQRTHLAIMKKSWGLIPKIISGEKTIESRWYKNRLRPWNRVSAEDIVYFKDSGEPVTVRARVSRVKQHKISSDDEALALMEKYAAEDLGVTEIPSEIRDYIIGKRYAIFIFFDAVEQIEPFEINKLGFGAQAAWLIVDNIEKLKRK